MGWIVLLMFVGLIALIVFYLKAFYAEREKRQEKAQENIMRNGGQRVLEWSAPMTAGSADDEFGELITEIPAKMGEGAKFYKLGCTIGNKRVPYLNISDILVEDATSGGGGIVRNSGKIWIYRHKGSTIGLNSLTHKIDCEVGPAIKRGLGF